MGRKIFVSYKFADNQVENLPGESDSTVRDYVNEFERLIDLSDHIYKGESDGEDLSALSEETIWQKLRDRIYDSSITIIFISPGMKENGKSEKAQWIPWEVSYSLKEISRRNKNGEAVTSKTNAMVAVVLPDVKGLYSYYLDEKDCCASGCVIHHTDKLFRIIKNNKFNKKYAAKGVCEFGRTIWNSEESPSYIAAVKWCDFKADYNKYIDAAYERQNNLENYDIEKEI